MVLDIVICSTTHLYDYFRDYFWQSSPKRFRKRCHYKLLTLPESCSIRKNIHQLMFLLLSSRRFAETLPYPIIMIYHSKTRFYHSKTKISLHSSVMKFTHYWFLQYWIDHSESLLERRYNSSTPLVCSSRRFDSTENNSIVPTSHIENTSDHDRSKMQCPRMNRLRDTSTATSQTSLLSRSYVSSVSW